MESEPMYLVQLKQVGDDLFQKFFAQFKLVSRRLPQRGSPTPPMPARSAPASSQGLLFEIHSGPYDAGR